MPAVAHRIPESRMRHAVRALPFPVGRRPQTAVLIPPRSHELEVLAIGYFVPVDDEPRNAHFVSLVFVIPAELWILARKSESDASVRDFYHFRLWLATLENPRLRLPDLLIGRHLVQHVRQRLSMHEPVFDRRIQQCFAGPFQCAVKRLTNTRR